MKYLLIFAVGVCLLFSSVPAMADQAADEAAIREVVKQELAAYNMHDAKGAFVTRAEDYENWSGSRKGRMANEKYFMRFFEGRGKDFHVKEEEIGILFITPEVAIYKARGVESGLFDEDGKPLPPREYLFAQVYVKRNGNWLAVASFDTTIEE